eukprot:7103997-Pyramimonas_sp.AAC.1
MLDYGIISPHARLLISSFPADTSAAVARNAVAGKAHYGLKIGFRPRAVLAQARLYSLPRSFTHQPLLGGKAYPTSKRSRKAATAADMKQKKLVKSETARTTKPTIPGLPPP